MIDETTEHPRVSFSAMRSDKLGATIKSRSLEPYPCEFHGTSEDMNSFERAVAQGIDSHLEVMMFSQDIGSHGRIRFVLRPSSVAVLVRRLLETGEDNDMSLASSICETLNIELV